MKILFVVPYVPNLIRVRPYNLIRSLTNNGHRVSVMTLWTGDAEKQSVDLLRSFCHEVTALELPKWRSTLNCLAALPTPTPLQAVYCWQPDLAGCIAAAAQPREGAGHGFDVIHIEHLRGANYGLKLNQRQAKGRAIPIVWDSVDCISYLFTQSSLNSKKVINRLITRFELSRTKKYEDWLLDQFDRVLVTSRIDRDALINLRRNARAAGHIQVLPNGVNLEYFAPDNKTLRERATLVISGKMSYHANVSMVLNFTSHILPLIRAGRPDIKLLIVGKDPPPEIIALGNQPNITVTGTVGDIRPYLQRASLAVAPLTYGAGIQNKVLEAMACGTPVVTTSKAIAALDVTSGRELLVGDSPMEFSKEVLRLLENSALSQAVGAAGRRYVEEHHSWPMIARRLEQIYQEAACERENVVLNV